MEDEITYSEEFAKSEIFSELDAIIKLYDFTPKEAYEDFLDDINDCLHVGEYKLKYAKEWLKEKENETI